MSSQDLFEDISIPGGGKAEAKSEIARRVRVLFPDRRQIELRPSDLAHNLMRMISLTPEMLGIGIGASKIRSMAA